MKDSETLTRGDMLNIESGEVDLAVTSDAALAGIFVGPENPNDAVDGKPGTLSGTDSTTIVKVIVNPDAVYADANDTNARLAGATLDISGATGAQTLAASSNTEFVVVERKRQSSDETRVMICSSAHYLAKAQ
jgi:spermidine/putrescine-binding protein